MYMLTTVVSTGLIVCICEQQSKSDLSFLHLDDKHISFISDVVDFSEQCSNYVLQRPFCVEVYLKSMFNADSFRRFGLKLKPNYKKVIVPTLKTLLKCVQEVWTDGESEYIISSKRLIVCVKDNTPLNTLDNLRLCKQ